jgi:hypothetical protein
VRADAASGNLWAGGENGIFAPWIARSTDQGDTWQLSYPDMAGDNACNSIAVHPADPDVAYAGMEGAVIRTEDGGMHWQPTGLVDTPAYTYGLALDSAAPAHILAGGLVANPNSWALWESFDAGVTWQVVDPPAPLTAGISSIVADPLRGGVFYIATFGNGVFRYRRTASGGEPLPTVRARLLPARPNPFNARTLLPFGLPESLAGRVTLAIYDARGELKRVLLDATLPSGSHQYFWDGTDARGRSLASGVYYCRLHARGIDEQRAVVLVK